MNSKTANIHKNQSQPDRPHPLYPNLEMKGFIQAAPISIFVPSPSGAAIRLLFIISTDWPMFQESSRPSLNR
ncbi:hypothetical protein [Paenibacillus sp. BK720]|uniref:hypothetical protein n=1 Tax=Paenibacillus sp. BK720 TaxID=2587092 RepID=UPI001ABA32F1